MFLTKRFNLICGHYGSGKTNLSLNLALLAAKEGRNVTLVDLDLVNPYFRSSDYAKLLQNENIRVIAPVYANSNVDIPSLPPEINSIFTSDDTVILDVGGDDAGATVLGRFASRISELDYDLFYVINHYRNLTAKPSEAVEVLREIEAVSRLTATGIINNSHLKSETTPETIMKSMEFARKVSNMTGLPLRAVTAERSFADEVDIVEPVLPIGIYVKTEWE